MAANLISDGSEQVQAADVAGRSPDFSWLAAASVVIAFAFCNAFLFSLDWFVGISEMLGFLLAGCCAIQPILIGFWAALGPGAWVRRLPVAVNSLAIVLLAIGILPPMSENTPNADREFIAILSAVGLTLFCFATLVGFITRPWHRRRIWSPEERAGRGVAAGFSIKDMLWITTLTAISLAMAGRTLSSTVWGEAFAGTRLVEDFIVPTAVIFGLCLPTVVVPWIILSNSGRRMAIVVGLLFWLATTALLIILVEYWIGEELFPYLFPLQAGAALIGMLSALALRTAGFQFSAAISESAASFSPHVDAVGPQ